MAQKAKRAAAKKKGPSQGAVKKLASKLKTAKAAVKKKALAKKKAPAKKTAGAKKRVMPRKSDGALGTSHRGAAKNPAVGKRPPGSRVSARLSGASVDDYITSVPAPFKAVLAELRQVVMTAAPEATCAIKWGQPVFECNGPFAWMKAFSSHANLGFFRGSELADPDRLLTGTGSKMRHVKITEPEHIPVAKLDALVRAAVALNKQKGAPAAIAGR